MELYTSFHYCSRRILNIGYPEEQTQLFLLFNLYLDDVLIPLPLALATFAVTTIDPLPSICEGRVSPEQAVHCRQVTGISRRCYHERIQSSIRINNSQVFITEAEKESTIMSIGVCATR